MNLEALNAMRLYFAVKDARNECAHPVRVRGTGVDAPSVVQDPSASVAVHVRWSKAAAEAVLVTTGSSAVACLTSRARGGTTCNTCVS
jgi:hypothetical protein